MIEIKLSENETQFVPGQTIQGTVRGSTAHASADEALAVRLIWYTSGKGTRDFAIVDERLHPLAGATKVDYGFEFIAPRRPLSFTGQLISLQWAVEAVQLPSKRSARIDIVIAHGPSEIQLASVADEMKAIGVSKPWLRIGSS